MSLINITINADSHDEYKAALKLLSAGIGAADMKVKKTSTELETAEDEDDEEDKVPAKKKPASAPAKKPAPKKPTKPEPEDDDTEEDDEDEAEEKVPAKKKGGKEVDLETIRAAAHEKNKTHKEDVKKLVKSFGVGTFSELGGTKLQEFYTKLLKIGTKKKAAEEDEEEDDFMG